MQKEWGAGEVVDEEALLHELEFFEEGFEKGRKENETGVHDRNGSFFRGFLKIGGRIALRRERGGALSGFFSKLSNPKGEWRIKSSILKSEEGIRDLIE